MVFDEGHEAQYESYRLAATRPRPGMIPEGMGRYAGI